WDFDGDGHVGPSDLELLTQNLGPCEDPEECPFDLNGDGVVNGSDVAALVLNFGPCPSEVARSASWLPSQDPQTSRASDLP
ncbi:MAG: dockerin type I domain-containing protein, partial [Planctomycetota bacterium]